VSRLSKNKGIVVLLIVMFTIAVPLTITTPVHSAGQHEVPNINKAAWTNPVADIGPGFPAVAHASEHIIFHLKPDFSSASVEGIEFLTVVLDQGKLKLLKYEAPGFIVNGDEVNVTLPENIEPGVYDIVLTTGDGYKLFVPRALWVEGSLQGSLKYMHISDVHFGAGTPSVTIGQNRRFVG
jgi:hypothetical protein